MVKAIGSMYTELGSQFLPVVFTDFANSYSEPVRISTWEWSISIDMENIYFQQRNKTHFSPL